MAAINTIAARQQVINDLYRIMKITGFPRVDVTILEEVVTKAAPSDVKADKDQLRLWLNDRMNEVRNTFTNLRADQALVHFDSGRAQRSSTRRTQPRASTSPTSSMCSTARTRRVSRPCRP